MPRRIPELEYGDDVEVRRVSQQGGLKMNGERTFVSETFAYEWLGLTADRWALSRSPLWPEDRSP
jgi:hypothetical protein